jgi:protein involved in polysaccharide export with SLBB domain
LGKINTVDKDFSEIESEIIAGYETLYANPEIVVRPLLQINILGEVRNPGVYYLSGFETLSELFEIAGGETSDANINKIILVRNDNILDLDLSSFLYGGNNLNDIGITSGDKIYIPKNWWVEVRDASILVSGVTVLVALASIITN